MCGKPALSPGLLFPPRANATKSDMATVVPKRAMDSHTNPPFHTPSRRGAGATLLTGALASTNVFRMTRLFGLARPNTLAVACILASACALPCAIAQTPGTTMPNAIVRDPPRDSAHPMHNEAVWIPSGDVRLNGVMLAAAGVGPHPTVLNLHGLPGNEENLDLAQVLRRAGYNVLSFHYRGSWGSPGAFTLARGVADGVAALAFLRDPTVVARFRIDTTRLIVLGHSYGGFVAVRVAATHPHLAGLVLLAPWNPAPDVPMFMVASDKLPAAAHAAFDDVDGRLGGYTDVDLAKEIVAEGYDWHLESGAAALRHVPILVVTATHDTPDDQGAELMDALTQVRAPDVTRRSLDTDHPFSDHRIALETTILQWFANKVNAP